MKFSIGDLIIEKKTIEPHTSYVIYKVVATLDGALLAVHWGGGYGGDIHEDEWEDEPGSRSWRSALQRYQEEELFSLEEAEKERLRLEVSKNSLNQEFETIRDQLRSKLDQAAVLVREAGDLVKAHDKEFYDLKQECMPLYNALKDGGWSHSHMKC